MESSLDKLQGWAISLLLHALCFGALFLGLSWSAPSRPVKVPGLIMEATLMQPPTRLASQQKPSPKPEQRSSRPAETAMEKAKPDELIVQEQILRRQEEAVRQQALATEKAEQVKEAERRKQEAAQQEQERLRKLEEVRKQRMEAERKRQDEELKLRRIEEERDRAAEEQRKDLEKQRMQQMMDAEVSDREQMTAGQEGVDASLAAQYQAAVTLAIRNAWLRPATARAGLSCVIRVHQIPGGEVVARNVVTWKCNGDEAVQRSIEAAVDRASPLPYKGYEKVFERELVIDFRPTGG